MTARSHRRQALALAAIACGMALRPVHAIMAGTLPDSAAARVDPNTDTSPWRGVVSVQTPAGIFSGVVVGRRHVLTAAHVLDTLPVAADVQVTFNVAALPQSRRALRYTRHPEYVAFGVPNLANDLALIELDEDRPATSLSYVIDPFPAAAGAVVTVVGYGASGNGTAGASVPRSSVVKRVGGNVIDALGTDAAGVPRLFQWDFDGPTAATNFVGGLTLGNAVETTLAGGDSGAPVFRLSAGQTWLYGIGTFTGGFAGGPTGQGVFGTAGGGQVLAGYATWINDVIVASGYGEPQEDVPLPAWALWMLGSILGASALRGRMRRRSPATTTGDP
jgi:secreted trypsin-like serine protease